MPRTSKRTGITRIDVLFVLASLVLILGMSLAGLNKVWLVALRLKCNLNLHHTGIGVCGFADQHGVLPPLSVQDSDPPGSLHSDSHIKVPGPYQGATGTTVFFWVLPHIGEEALFRAGQLDVNTVVRGRPVYGTPVKAFHCPADPGGGDGTIRARRAAGWATGNYAANYLVFGDPARGSMEGQARYRDSFPDGTSNTILLAERYRTCGTDGDIDGPNTFGNLWASSNPGWRPSFCVNTASQVPAAPGYHPCAMFQERPGRLVDCDSSRAQSPHPGGIFVGMADGSARFVVGTVLPSAWAQACDPRDGVAMPPNW